MTRVYWKGDPQLPPLFANLTGGAIFRIAIREWMSGQDYQQLGIFREKAGFDFWSVLPGAVVKK